MFGCNIFCLFLFANRIEIKIYRTLWLNECTYRMRHGQSFSLVIFVVCVFKREQIFFVIWCAWQIYEGSAFYGARKSTLFWTWIHARSFFQFSDGGKDSRITKLNLFFRHCWNHHTLIFHGFYYRKHINLNKKI